MTGQGDGWKPHADGLVKGTIGVFPGLLGGWYVWRKRAGMWEAVRPSLVAEREGVDHDRHRDPPFQHWKRTREETIEAAKLLAEGWLARQRSGDAEA